MWHLKTTTRPVIVEVLGIIKKGTDKHINQRPDYSNPYEMQKHALSGTVDLLRRVLSIWTRKKKHRKEAAKQKPLSKDQVKILRNQK